MTKQEELDLVNKAIREILEVGQSTAYQGRSNSMANYDQLVKRKTQLESEIQQQASGGRSRVLNVTPLS